MHIHESHQSVVAQAVGVWPTISMYLNNTFTDSIGSLKHVRTKALSDFAEIATKCKVVAF